MARRRFGADLSAVAWRTVTADAIDDVVQLARSVSGITAWDAEESGTQLTDLLDADGVAIPGGIITASASGLIDFFGPDTTPETLLVWLDAGAGTRQRIIAADAIQQVGDIAAAAAANAAAITALQTAVPSLGINVQTGTTYTVAMADHDGVVERSNASANTVTAPAEATVSLPVGWFTTIRQTGAGLTTVQAGGGATLTCRGKTAPVALAGQWAEATLSKRGTNAWNLAGDVAP
jgi:hypothetical protein